MIPRTFTVISILSVCLMLACCSGGSGGSSGAGTGAGSGGASDIPGGAGGSTGTSPGTPSCPSALTGRSLVQLVWQPSIGATSYNVYRNGSLAASVAAFLYYIDTGLTLGTAYTYEISAVNSSGESGMSTPVTATTALWTKLLSSSSADYASGIALDGAGNFFVVGWTEGNLGGMTNAGAKDVFIAKYDPTGTLQWVQLLGTSANEEATAVAVDPSGYVYVTGYTDGNLGGQTNIGGEDIFIAKYDTSGTLQWVQLLGTSANEWGNGIAVDALGYVYVTGYTVGNLGAQTNAGGEDIFIAKYDTSGTLQWVQLLGTPVNDVANAIAADAAGNTYITGYTAGNLGGQTNAGGDDIFTAAYNTSGTLQWVQLLGTPVNDVGNGIALGPSGTLCITGYTNGNLGGLTNTGARDAFLAAYNTSGTQQWVQLLGTSANTAGNGIAIDASGNSYIAGYTDGNLGGQTNAGGDDIFIAAYNTSGTLQWVELEGTPANDGANAIALDPYANSYLAGYTGGNLDGLANTDSSGAFIAKVTSNGIFW